MSRHRRRRPLCTLVLSVAARVRSGHTRLSERQAGRLLEVRLDMMMLLGTLPVLLFYMARAAGGPSLL